MRMTFRRPAGRFPAADRSRDGDLYEHMHPRKAAVRLLREKLADRHAGLDPYDPSILVVKVGAHERVWAHRALELVGCFMSESNGRMRAVVEADVRTELGLDQPDAPLIDDEPLASRSVTAPHAELLMDATLRSLNANPRLRIVGDPDQTLMRNAMLKAQHLAALELRCGRCGTPAYRPCDCGDVARLEAASESDLARLQAQNPGRQVH
jgi:hypothetical protein